MRGNRIRNAAFSAVRGNAASNLQIVGNTCTGLGEVALYAEFGFEGAVIANNIVDGAAIGVSVTNFNDGGRLAVVQGNLIRNLVATAPGRHRSERRCRRRHRHRGRHAGDRQCRSRTRRTPASPPAGADICATFPSPRNVVRGAGYGITVSVAPGAGTTLIANNLDLRARGSAPSSAWNGKSRSADLTRDGATRYAQLSLNGNQVR